MCVEKLITDKNTADIYSVEFKRFIKRHDLTSVQPYNSDEAEHLWISLLSNNKICTYTCNAYKRNLCQSTNLIMKA